MYSSSLDFWYKKGRAEAMENKTNAILELSVFKVEDFMIFNWIDLNSKTLKIFVTDDENGICVSGTDVESGNIYILYSKIKEE